MMVIRGMICEVIVLKFIKSLFCRNPHHQLGYEYGYKYLNVTACGDIEYDNELVQKLLREDHGQFHSKRDKHEFELGIRDAIVEYERQFGAP